MNIAKLSMKWTKQWSAGGASGLIGWFAVEGSMRWSAFCEAENLTS